MSWLTASPDATALERPARDDDADDGALRLPQSAPPARRSTIPLVASAVPVVAAVGLWLATGTTTMLWFAALGPLIAVASLADTARTTRRARRLAAHGAERARRRATAAIDARHASERAALWARHPDVLRLLEPEGPLDEVWRPVAGREGTLVVGCGPARSAVRLEGGDDDAQTRELRRRAARLDAAPVAVPASGGVAVVGPPALAAAVVRALVLQLCLALPPGRLRILPLDGGADIDEWLAGLPHAAARPRRTDRHDALMLAVCGPRDATPADADIVIARVTPGEPAPPRCRAVLTLTGIDTARLARDGESTHVQIEGIGAEQARAVARSLAERAEAAFGPTASDDPVGLADLLAADSTRAGAGASDVPSRSGLSAVVGTAGGRPFRLDLVADGPHAVVAGVTGSGKSELLTTWVTALCARYTTDEVTFLLADFKGGTAFDALAGVPHVTGVITDLDARGAGRALQSLRAELRRREAEIVRAGGRDIDDTDLPRLVIVVDEFAALLAGHPELHELFTDIAARGRALGMHLILGTQRATGAFRDALLANCPLRISLRVTDPADSRLLVGTEDAAALSGAAEHRGVALVRRGADADPTTVRIALSSAQLVASVAARARGPVPRRPWLPALPAQLSLAEASASAPPGIVLGRADEPERQRQSPVVLEPGDRGLCAVGMPGSGRTSLLELVAAQAGTAVWIPPHPEAAWDVIARLADAVPEHGTVILADDLDALLAQFPLDYAQALGERLERLFHAAGGGGPQVVMSAQRVTGALSRLADLVPRRVILRCASRIDVVSAGGEACDFDDRMPPGRAVLDGALVQLARSPRPAVHPAYDPMSWRPHDGLTGVVTRPGAARAVAAHADASGAETITVDAAAARSVDGVAGPLVVIGDGEQWQRSWRLLQTVRSEGDLLVDAGCGADYRLLTGDRALPPYCLPGRGRAWLVRGGAAPVRVVVPG